MQFFIHDLAGRSNAVTADPASDVAGLKAQIAASQGIPAEEQRLIFGGRSLG
eukprot:CAMPEP_0194478696 /NCGR_PEP_ID=MMETSP0253-20130528/2054_1 /TAXON_ID=2966 /ORGANISM="Noctiluca scintillans" /LENGTH=51 /DNA_ID=CAMNT_0039317813 /DNA_START=57 /DNA_END=208 /DNA_ORIENTATION=+